MGAKLAMGCIISSCVLVTLVSSALWLSFVSSRQPVRIHDIPLYPEAKDVVYKMDIPLRPDCSGLSFIGDFAPQAVVDFYRQALPKQGWLGGGDTEYPQPLLFVRKVPGHFQTVQIMVSQEQAKTEVKVQLCEDN